MFTDKNVEAVFQGYSTNIKERCLLLRELIFDVATKTKGVGEVTETLKWGQTSYLTLATKSGSTIRIGEIKQKNKKDLSRQYAIYFHCQTNLVETFKVLFPTQFKYQGHRAIVFDLDDEIAIKELRYCIELALTYHLNKNT